MATAFKIPSKAGSKTFENSTAAVPPSLPSFNPQNAPPATTQNALRTPALCFVFPISFAMNVAVSEGTRIFSLRRKEICRETRETR
jgi:hypothetical protein